MGENDEEEEKKERKKKKKGEKRRRRRRRKRKEKTCFQPHKVKKPFDMYVFSRQKTPPLVAYPPTTTTTTTTGSLPLHLCPPKHSKKTKSLPIFEPNTDLPVAQSRFSDLRKKNTSKGIIIPSIARFYGHPISDVQESWKEVENLSYGSWVDLSSEWADSEKV